MRKTTVLSISAWVAHNAGAPLEPDNAHLIFVGGKRHATLSEVSSGAAGRQTEVGVNVYTPLKLNSKSKQW